MSAYFRLIRLALTIGLAIEALVACSGGGLNTPAGTQCAGDTYNPIPMTIAPYQQKVNLKVNDPTPPAGTVQLAPGTYSFTRADFFFVDNDAIAGLKFMIHTTNAPVNGAFQKGITCLRNAKARIAGRSVTANAVTNMVITAQEAASIVISPISVTLDAQRNIIYDFKNLPPAATPTAVSPDTVYTDPSGKLINSFMIVNPGGIDYEVRSQYLDNQGSYFISVHMSFAPPH